MHSLMALTSSTGQISQVLIIVAVLVVIWIILRFILKLAMRVVVSGCVVILLIGIVLTAATFMR